VPSGGTCPIRIAHGAANNNITLLANMTREVVVVLNAGSFRVDVAPASLSAVTGAVDGARLTVDARALDIGRLGAESNIVAPLFASLNTSLNNVAALRVVASDCLTVSNATLAVAGQLVVAIFHAIVRAACVSTSTSLASTAVPSSTATATLTLVSSLGILVANTTTATDATMTNASSSSTKAEATSTATLTLVSSLGILVANTTATATDATTTNASSSSTKAEATVVVAEPAVWVLPVAVVGAVVGLLVGVGVAVLVWKRQQSAAASERGAEMVTARADDGNNYGVLPGVRTYSHYAEHAADFKVTVADPSAHYDSLAEMTANKGHYAEDAADFVVTDADPNAHYEDLTEDAEATTVLQKDL
jgi:hypothetical protein